VHVPLSPSSIASRDVISFVKGGMTGIYTSGNGKCPGDFFGGRDVRMPREEG